MPLRYHNNKHKETYNKEEKSPLLTPQSLAVREELLFLLLTKYTRVSRYYCGY